MNEFQLKRLMTNVDLIDDKIRDYTEKKVLWKQEKDKDEIDGHRLKSMHNLEFASAVSKKDFPDWVLVGCYYSVYHAALALILNRGYSSKNHDATLCVLVKEYHKGEINVDDMELINFVYLNKEDILFYVHSKNERESASYSTRIKFDKSSINEMLLKTRLFVNKAKEIIEND